MRGILLIHKEEGMTSHDVVNRLRRKLGTRRIGHSGTLDPQATGLLVMAVGHATRFLNFLHLEPKVYEGEIQFGETRNTQDREGEVTSTAPVPDDLESRVLEVIPSFVGAIQQIPPMFSAVKIGGKPLYKMAREGEEIDREPRSIEIHGFDIRFDQPDKCWFRVECSGGTYVRTLAHDIGQAVGCGAYLASLVRTSVGRFTLEQASLTDDVTESSLIPLGDALQEWPMVRLTETQLKVVRNGQPVIERTGSSSEFAMLTTDAEGVIAVAKVMGPQLQPVLVIPAE